MYEKKQFNKLIAADRRNMASLFLKVCVCDEGKSVRSRRCKVHGEVQCRSCKPGFELNRTSQKCENKQEKQEKKARTRLTIDNASLAHAN